jgi:hypothetical protein
MQKFFNRHFYLSSLIGGIVGLGLYLASAVLLVVNTEYPFLYVVVSVLTVAAVGLLVSLALRGYQKQYRTKFIPRGTPPEKYAGQWLVVVYPFLTIVSYIIWVVSSLSLLILALVIKENLDVLNVVWIIQESAILFAALVIITVSNGAKSFHFVEPPAAKKQPH